MELLLEDAVVSIATITGQTFQEFENFKKAEEFLQGLVENNDFTTNYKDDEQWYLENQTISYELRYKGYED